jgi:hypothetical protein
MNWLIEVRKAVIQVQHTTLTLYLLYIKGPPHSLLNELTYTHQ